MPYIPPHLRPGYIQTVSKKPEYTGKVHWPTNMNNRKQNNIIQPALLHVPRKYDILSAKSALKLSKPIKINVKPAVEPGSRVSKFHNAVTRHIRSSKAHQKPKSRKRKYSKKTRKHKL